MVQTNRTTPCPKQGFFIILNIKKRPVQSHRSGIKNSWKYEKDLIILNVKDTFVAIRQVSYSFLRK